jgi:hypothetical protein
VLPTALTLRFDPYISIINTAFALYCGSLFLFYEPRGVSYFGASFSWLATRPAGHISAVSRTAWHIFLTRKLEATDKKQGASDSPRGSSCFRHTIMATRGHPICSSCRRLDISSVNTNCAVCRKYPSRIATMKRPFVTLQDRKLYPSTYYTDVTDMYFAILHAYLLGLQTHLLQINNVIQGQ